MTRKMSRRLHVLGVALIVILSMSACGNPGAASVTLCDTDRGGTVELKSGDTLIVKLEGNPSTGFAWEVVSADIAVLEQEGEFEFEAEKPGMPGSGGTLTFTFKAASRGQTDLQLVYHRPWEEDSPPSQTFDVTVVVD